MNKENIPSLLETAIWTSTCPACGYHVAVPFFDGDMQPLATIAWPTDSKTAQNLPKLPLNFVRCVDCGHVYNATFDYENIPYSEKPNLMFNQGANWSGFIKDLRNSILQHLPDNPTVVEIGHGDGSFLAALSDGRSTGKFIGFDPHGATKAPGSIQAAISVNSRRISSYLDTCSST